MIFFILSDRRNRFIRGKKCRFYFNYITNYKILKLEIIMMVYYIQSVQRPTFTTQTSCCPPKT